MEPISVTLIIAFLILGLIATIFSLFGTLIIFLTALVSSFTTNFTLFSTTQLFILAFLYIIGELLEFLFSYFGARKFGATKAAAWGSIVGIVVGAIAGSIIPIIGVFLGSIIGLFLGAFIVELSIKKNIFDSIKAGSGSLFGRLSAIIGKLVIAIIMCIIILTAVY